MATLGERIRAQRRACGLTQDLLAARAGMSKITLHKIEVGLLPDPRVSYVVQIAAVLQVPVDVLVGGKGGRE